MGAEEEVTPRRKFEEGGGFDGRGEKVGGGGAGDGEVVRGEEVDAEAVFALWQTGLVVLVNQEGNGKEGGRVWRKGE